MKEVERRLEEIIGRETYKNLNDLFELGIDKKLSKNEFEVEFTKLYQNMIDKRNIPNSVISTVNYIYNHIIHDYDKGGK